MRYPCFALSASLREHVKGHGALLVVVHQWAAPREQTLQIKELESLLEASIEDERKDSGHQFLLLVALITVASLCGQRVLCQLLGLLGLRFGGENLMSSEDREAQEDELLAPESIYNGDEFRTAESVQGGETRIYLDLPQNFKIFLGTRDIAKTDPKTEQELTSVVQTLLQQIQDKFQTMSDQIIGRIDDMSSCIDDLKKNIADLMTQPGVEELEGENKIPATQEVKVANNLY
ncbi:PREDICTED: uncharacterized protein LOC105532406 [Mandrillus leucophaeus]|uniref:uncharacterized protein LOC105532406 n=1 Tax=Mandrillus leucophaeus TaxID=9568 RepID=UPI0005F3AEDC|nr:PREDICTED: uncharacterized protein LOC105532406 [Mandrillus leucophaeus]